ncbi:type II toxin-antitoxin system HicA family toxin [Candidatus Moduliflexota bacterium]
MASTLHHCPNFGDHLFQALRRDGLGVARQRGSHIRLHKTSKERLLKLTISAHRPIKRSTLSHILKHAQISTDHFLTLI